MMLHFTLRVLFYYLGFALVTAKADSAATTSARQQLLTYIFANYNPVNYPTNPVVTVQLSPADIDTDVKRQILKLDTTIGLSWVDSRLSWNPANYGGIQFIVIPSTQIWLPDTSYLPSPTPVLSDGQCDPSSVVIRSDGTVNYTPQCALKPFCPSLSQLVNYPNGPVTCSLQLASWSFIEPGITYAYFGNNAQAAVDLESNWANLVGGWEITGVAGSITSVPFTCCPQGSYSTAVFNLTIQRPPSTCYY